MSLTLEIRSSLKDVDANHWNALSTDGNPFVRYEFLYGLEATGCLGADKGWYPQYFLLWKEDIDGDLVAAMPAYVKTHSYGEFVFDWAWADAYDRHGESYYPKLVCAIPFTPATGPRLLIRGDQPFEATADVIISTVCQYATEQKFSSAHWLFTSPKDALALTGETERAVLGKTQAHLGAALDDEGMNDEVMNDGRMDDGRMEAESNTSSNPTVPLLRRMDCQYHWHNEGYQSFDEFLARCTAKRRKTLRRERRYVSDAGITLERRQGSSLSDEEWEWVHEFYVSTFEAKWGNPSLTAEFFKRMGGTFGDATLVVFAYDPNDELPDKPVACSILFHGGDCLYGRFWGCRKEHHCLHFEACYYQGIEHCIAHQIPRFEPGAQGEHKITRGFVPTLTESAHYIAHPGFRDAISKYLDEEKKHVRDRCTGLSDLLPFKADTLTLGTDANPVHSS